MKQYITAVCCITLVLSTSTLQAKTKTMSVQVDQREIRSGSTFFDRVVGKVSYGDRVEILQTKSGWSKVKTQKTGLTGWIHSSALTKKKIKLSAGDKDVASGASSEEVALAGKGFNPSVEKEYRKQNPKIDFAPVDKMEKMKIPAKDIKSFFDKGGVK